MAQSQSLPHPKFAIQEASLTPAAAMHDQVDTAEVPEGKQEGLWAQTGADGTVAAGVELGDV